MRSLLRFRLLLGFFLLLAPGAFANTINGTVYCNLSSSDASSTPVPGTTPSSGTVCATFQTTSINFYNYSSSTNTIGSFLNSTGSIIGSVTYLNGYTASTTLDYSLFEFTGSAYLGQGGVYSVTHDDGTVMQIDGVTVVSSPGPSSSVTNTFTYNGTTGFHNFAYNFTEIQGSTVIYTNAANTPEPSTLLLLAPGLIGVLGLRKIRKNRTADLG